MFIMTRQQRKLEAKLNGVKFDPQYNGNSPVAYEDVHGVGKERFNNKFVDFTVKPVEIEKLELDVVNTPTIRVESTMESELIDTTAVKSKGLIAKAKGFFSKGKR